MRLGAALLGGCAGAFAFAAAAQLPAYQLGFSPFLSPARLEDFAGGVTPAFAAAVGRPVTFHTKASFEQFQQALDAGSYDIALVHAFDYVEHAAPQGYLPLARLDRPFVGTVVTAPQSPLRELRELKDRVLALPQPGAAAARTLPLLLAQAGLRAGELRLQSYGSHEACFQAALSGRADACLSHETLIRLFEQGGRLRLRKLGDSPAVPHVLFVAHARVPLAERRRLERAVLALGAEEPTRTRYERLGMQPFVPAQDSDFDQLRRMLAAAAATD